MHTQWRTAKEQDALRQPKCRVRDSGGHWQDAVLYAVYGNHYYAAAKGDEHLNAWHYCEVEDDTRSKGYLCLSRRKDETILIGDSVEVMVSDIIGNRVIIAIKAPRDMRIVRSEITEQIHAN
jgi:carbon storage regulator